MNNNKMRSFLSLSLLPMAAGASLMREEGVLSFVGAAIMSATSLGSLSLIGYLYYRERIGTCRSRGETKGVDQSGKAEPTERIRDDSGGNVSPLFAAIALGLIAIIIIMAFSKGM